MSKTFESDWTIKEESGARRIYVASSWRNEKQPGIVKALRGAGHEVYDFRNPRNGDGGFHWSEIDPNWRNWTPSEYREHLHDPIVIDGFISDFNAMEWADTFILVQPCGRSAHLELGWACGTGKKACILLDDNGGEPELMVKMVDHIALDIDEVIRWLYKW